MLISPEVRAERKQVLVKKNILRNLGGKTEGKRRFSLELPLQDANSQVEQM
jgi:hypothetical protein